MRNWTLGSLTALGILSQTISPGMTSLIPIALGWSRVTTLGDDPPSARIRGLFDTHCYRCHSGEDRESELELAEYIEAPRRLLEEPKVLTKLMRVLREKEMPPKAAEPKLGDDDRKRLIEWANSIRKEPG